MNPVLVLAATVVTLMGCAAAPRPAMPDGTSREAINTAQRIEAFQERLQEMRDYEAEKVRWAQEVTALRHELAQLRSATIILATNAEDRASLPRAMTQGRPGVGNRAIAQITAPVLPAAGHPAFDGPAGYLTESTAGSTMAPAATLGTPATTPAVQTAPATPQSVAGEILNRASPSDRPVRVRVLSAPVDVSTPPASPAPMVDGMQATGLDAHEPQGKQDRPPVAGPGPAVMQPTTLEFDSRSLEIGVPRPPAPAVDPREDAVRQFAAAREAADRTRFVEIAARAPARVPSRSAEVTDLSSRPAIAFRFDEAELAQGFLPDDARSGALIDAAQRSVRIVIHSRITAAAADASRVRHAHQTANEARSFLVRRGIDPSRIYLTTTRGEPDRQHPASRALLLIEMDGAAAAQSAPTAPETPARPGIIDATRLAVGVN
ncbi:MAG: hypothetical protein AB7P21_30090 [Lautropia sp.]